MSGYTDDFGPNVANILAQASRVIRGRVPAQVRKELMAAVKAGALGRLKRQGLKPEIFFHPDHLHGAIDRQRREFEYSANLIKGVFATQERRDELLAEMDATLTSQVGGSTNG